MTEDIFPRLPNEMIDYIASNFLDLSDLSNLRQTNVFLSNLLPSMIDTIRSTKQIIVTINRLTPFYNLKYINENIIIYISSINDIHLLFERCPKLQRANFLIEHNYPNLTLASAIALIIVNYPNFEYFGFVSTDCNNTIIFDRKNKKISTNSNGTLLSVYDKLSGRWLNILKPINKFYMPFLRLYNKEILNYIREENIVVIPTSPLLLSPNMCRFLRICSIGSTQHLFKLLERIGFTNIPSYISEFCVQLSNIDTIIRDNISSTYLLHKNKKYSDMLFLYRPENIETFIANYNELEKNDI